MMKTLLKSILVPLLILEARAVLRKYKPKIVAITGTVGKTSTRDTIYAGLASSLSVRKAKKNFNTDIGIPITILDCGNPGRSLTRWLDVLFEGLKLILLPNHYPEWLVLEVGTDRPGDIAAVTKWLKPNVAVVTKLSKVPVHVEFFPSVERLFEEKGNLVKALVPNGTLVLNADDEDVMKYAALVPNKVTTFGETDEAHFSSERYEIVYDDRDRPVGVRFTVVDRVLGEHFPVMLEGTLGKHLTASILAAFCVADAVGEKLSIVAKAFQSYEPTPGRMRLVEGLEDSIIIDDTYNSSPVALEEALHTLKSLTRSKRRVAVLGDMLELGKFSIDEHKKAGRLAAESADLLITVGQRMSYAAESARQAGMKGVYECSNSFEAATKLKELLQANDAILVKGSQGTRTERVIEVIMVHPEDKEKLLVRQGKEWERK